MSKRDAHLTVAVSAWASRAVTGSVSLLSIPVLLSDLGEARYAAHVLLGGLAGWFLIADLGLRNATQNEVSQRLASGRGYSDVVLGGLLGSLLWTPVWVVLLVWTHSGLAELYLGGLGLSAREGETALLLTGGLGLFTSAANLVYNVWYAEGRGYRANAAAAAAALAGLGAAFGLSHPWPGHGSLHVQLVAVHGAPALLALGCLAVDLRRHGTAGALEVIGALRQLSLRARGFFGVSILSVLLLSIDAWVLASFLGPDAVVTFAVVSRPFNLFRIGYAALLQAVRPEWTLAFARRDPRRFAWLLARYHRWGMGLGVALTLGMSLVFWASGVPAGPLGPGLVLLFGGFEISRTHANTYFMALLAVGRLRLLTGVLAVQGLVVLGLESAGAPLFGIWALPLGGLAGYLAVSAWLGPLCLRLAMREGVRLNPA